MSISDTSRDIELFEGEIYTATILYYDTWHGVPIANATVMAISNNENIVVIDSIESDQESAGYYYISILGLYAGSTIVFVNVSKTGYEPVFHTFLINVLPGYIPPPPTPVFGLPIIIIIIIGVLVNDRRNRKLRENTDVVSESDLVPSTDGQPEDVETREL
jgi:hypothetical protein